MVEPENCITKTAPGANIMSAIHFGIGSLLAVIAMIGFVPGEDNFVRYEGTKGPGQGKHIVLVSGDEEYRSEEAMPQLGKILAKHHGFTCTVLFPIDKTDGSINPNQNDNIPGLEALKEADLLILFTRFRNLPEEQMKPLVDYIESGRPMIGLRTATHAFNIPDGRPFAEYSWQSKKEGFADGFGRQVLGETWRTHHGKHGSESTRGVIAPGESSHPILKGIKDGDIWGPTDVYGVRLPLPGDSRPLVMGQVLSGMKSTDPPVEGPQNDPLMPIAWTKSYKTKTGKTAKVFTTTMGASQDFLSEGLRRLLVNAAYWSLGMEDQITPDAPIDFVGDYQPTPFGFNKFQKGLRPTVHAWKPE
jgi:hypothetical protein